jgi:cyanate permease
MTLSVSCMVSVCFIILTLMSEILVPWGYTDHEASSMGFWGNLIGVAGGITAAIVITKTDRYKLTTSILIIGTILGAIGFELAATKLDKESGYWVTFTCLMIVCFTNMGLQSYCLEYAVFLAPEIGEAISGGTVC